MAVPDSTKAVLWTQIAARYDGDEDMIRQIYESTLRRIEWRKQRGFKTCVTCRQDKKPWEFGPDSAKTDGLSNRCRVCDRARKRAESTEE